MIFLKATYLVEGRNREIFLSRLKKHHVNILKVAICGEKSTEITIDNKDSHKFFAICGNIWYNKLLKMGGLGAPFYKLGKNPLIAVFILLFFAICFLSDNFYTGTIYKGESLFFKREIAVAFENNGISDYRYFNKKSLKKVEDELENNYGISFVKVEKWGNKAIIDIKRQKEPPSMLKKTKENIIAKEDMKILNITVYSGTPLFKKGDSVKKGETIVGAYYVEEGKQNPCDIIAEITAECDFVYFYESDEELSDTGVERGIIVAKFILGNYPVRSVKTSKISSKKVKITLKYEKNLCGG